MQTNDDSSAVFGNFEIQLWTKCRANQNCIHLKKGFKRRLGNVFLVIYLVLFFLVPSFFLHHLRYQIISFSPETQSLFSVSAGTQRALLRLLQPEELFVWVTEVSLFWLPPQTHTASATVHLQTECMVRKSLNQRNNISWSGLTVTSQQLHCFFPSCKRFSSFRGMWVLQYADCRLQVRPCQFRITLIH